jgi:hypothetical protein
LATLLRDSDVGDDLISAGMPAATRAAISWESAATYLMATRDTGFMRSLLLAFRDLFGFSAEHLTAETWADLSSQISNANQRLDWYTEVFTRANE